MALVARGDEQDVGVLLVGDALDVAGLALARGWFGLAWLGYGVGAAKDDVSDMVAELTADAGFGLGAVG